jgi:hypothetical protein
MNEFCLHLIVLLHILFIIFVILAPFSNIKYLLVMHAITVPFMLLHWITNNNTCALTLIERNVRKHLYGSSHSDSDCFSCRLIEPVYDFANNMGSSNVFFYITTITLWLITIYNIRQKFLSGEISSFYDLFR